MRLLLHVDGLLRRFGLPVPGAVALVGAVDRLGAGLGRGPRPVSLEAYAVRVDPGPEGDGALRRDLEALGGPLADLCPLLVRQTKDLVPGDSEPSIFLTGSRRIFQEAWALGVDTYLVGLESDVASRTVDFEDVPRLLEEKLRLPTARPMSPDSRTGGLLAVRCADPSAAWSRFLDLVALDEHADGTIVGNTLILYTENPDLEDELAEQPHAERLSYGVNKAGLGWVEGELEGLFTANGLTLVEHADENALPWKQARHRRLTVPSAQPGEDPTIQLRVLADSSLADRQADLESRLDPANPLASLAEILDPSACLDYWPDADRPRAAAWQIPGAAAPIDPLPVLVHTLRGPDDVAGVARAVIHGELLKGFSEGALSCVRVGDDLKDVELVRAFLMPEERARAKTLQSPTGPPSRAG